jgi:alkylated DNA repair dioxygenase AlkB
MFQQELQIINFEGEAIYYGPIFSLEQSSLFFDDLLNNIEWKNEEIIMFGKEIISKRKVAFYADDGVDYTYSNKTKKGLSWTAPLLKIKSVVENYTHVNYNGCLLNLYHDGNEAMGWHSDNEKEIMPNSSIASVSIGIERKFSFKNKLSKETVAVQLENGSLLEMKGTIQKNWLHALPKSKKISQPRINLTFRQFLK